MARGKNAPALFEVIRNAQEKQRQQDQRLREQAVNAATQATTKATKSAAASGNTTVASAATLLKSPLFWFKGRAAHDEVHGTPQRLPIEPVMREITPPPAEVNAAPAPRVIPEPVVQETAVERPTEPVTVAPAPAYRPAIAEYARQVREEIAAQDAPAAEPFFDSRRNAVDSRPAVLSDPAASNDDSSHTNQPEFAIDHERRQISLRLSYSNAIIAGFAIVVACGLAYVVGSSGRAKAPTIAESSPNPDVLNVEQPPNSVAVNTDPKESKETKGEARATLVPGPGDVSLDNGGQPIEVPTNVKRIVGYQYLVPMSFQNKAKADADGLVKFLANNGVGATVEKRPDWSATYYLVITTRGFEHTSKNSQYDVFFASLTKLMQKYSRNSPYSAGKPALYTWHSAN